MLKIPNGIIKISQYAQSLLAELPKFSKKEETGPQNRVLVGLDIGRTYVKVVQISQTPTSTILEKFACQKITPDTSVSAQLKHLFSIASITEKKVRVSLKGQGVILRFIPFPRMARDEFQSAIQYEAEKYIPFAISEVMLDFHILEASKLRPESSKTMDVILVAARKQEVMKLVKLLQEAELQPEAIDVDAIALSNFFLFAHKEVNEKVFVLIDFGAKDSNINIIDHGVLRFSRDIAFGGHDIMQLLKRKLQIEDQEAMAIQTSPQISGSPQAEALVQSYGFLIQEIKTSLNYFYGQHSEVDRPASIFACGGLAKTDFLRQTIEQETKISAPLWNPVETMTVAPDIKKEDLLNEQFYLPVSLGLALR